MELNIFNKRGQSMPSLPPLPPLTGEVEEYDPSKESLLKKPEQKAVKTNKKKKKQKKFSKKRKEIKPTKKKIAKRSLKERNIQSSPKKKVLKLVRKLKSRAVVKEAEKKENVAIKYGEAKGDVLETYELEVDGANAKAEIRKDEEGITYNLYIPEVSQVTSALLDEIRNELIAATTISMKELTDPSLFYRIKKRFMDYSRRLLREKLPHTKKDVEDFLVGILMQEMLGLGKIEFLIADPNLEEIVIPSSKEPIRVYVKKYGWLVTNLKIEREEDIINYSNIIARRVGKQITVLSPLLDAHLITGDRINAVLYPVNTKGNTITIRKFARDPFTIIDMITNKTCDANIASLLWMATEYEMNILISGGTASGKTSFLNACMPFIPPNQRIISIEDTRELMLPDFLYWAPLVTRTSNPEGKGEVSMLDLLVNSLRMRPDRVVLGEMRREKEAMVLFEAMHTGHSVYSTVHADSASETISRLVNPPLNVPPNLLKAVNLNVVMFRDRKKGIRRVTQVAEFETEKIGAKANILYRWVPDRDEIVRHSESSRFFEDLSRNTGMSQTDINNELKEKKTILEWLIKNNIRSLEDFGRVMNLFYRNKELLLKATREDNKKLIFKEKVVEKDKLKIEIGSMRKLEEEEESEDIVRDAKDSQKKVHLSIDSQGTNAGNFSVLDSKTSAVERKEEIEKKEQAEMIKQARNIKEKTVWK